MKQCHLYFEVFPAGSTFVEKLHNRFALGLPPHPNGIAAFSGPGSAYGLGHASDPPLLSTALKIVSSGSQSYQEWSTTQCLQRSLQESLRSPGSSVTLHISASPQDGAEGVKHLPVQLVLLYKPSR